MNSIITLENISKEFKNGDDTLVLFKGVNLSINKAESISITGPSGSGKSTLLHIMSTLEPPTSGDVIINKESTKNMSDKQLTLIRRSFSFMFQKTFLFPKWTVEENILLPSLIAKQSVDKSKLKELSEHLGIYDKLSIKTEKLSGGEKSRVALIRAILSGGDILFADEPTGSLDRDNAVKVENEMFSLVKDYGKSLVLITHSESLALKTDKCYQIVNKTLVQKGKE